MKQIVLLYLMLPLSVLSLGQTPPGPAGPIVGPSSVCIPSSGVGYSLDTIPGATSYTWSVPPGATIASGTGTHTITVNFPSGSSSGNISVRGVNAYGNGSPSFLYISCNARPVPTITGPSSACVNSTGNVYSTEAGMTNYSWSVSSGGGITAGGTSTSNTVTITWSSAGAKTLSVSYTDVNGCTSSPTSYPVIVSPIPVPTLSGPATVCINSTGNIYTTEPAKTNYLWTIPAGATVSAGGTTGDYSVTLNWTTTGAKVIKVNYTNQNGCTATSSAQLTITVNPLPVPPLNGPSSICCNTNTVYSTAAGQIGYIWTISPGGAVVSGQGTRIITVNWTTIGPNWIGVNYTNAAGCSAPSPTIKQVTVTCCNPPFAAGNITGLSTVIGGQNGVGYSVPPIPYATGYDWTLPVGAAIASGANTSSIIVNFSNSADSGTITVSGTNTCGTGTSSSFKITVDPPNLFVWTETVSGTTCFNAGQTITVAGGASTFTVVNGGIVTMIAGQQINYLPTTSVQSGGYMHGYITTTGSYCGSLAPSMAATPPLGTEETNPPFVQEGSFVKVYPNPTTGHFTLELLDNIPISSSFRIEIYGMRGEKLLNEQFNGEKKLEFSLDGRPAGIYVIRVLGGELSGSGKIIKL